MIWPSWQIPKGLTFYSKDTFLVTIVSVIFTIVRKWEQPKGPSLDEQTKKTWYTKRIGFYSAEKKKCNVENFR